MDDSYVFPGNLPNATKEKPEIEERNNAVDALAECWASIDGKLGRPDYEEEYEDGYIADAEELLFRLEKHGFTIVRR